MVIQGWKEYSFSQICEITAPLVDPRKKEFCELPHIGNENIEKETGKLLAYRSAREDGVISGKYFFDENEFLYAKIRPYFAKVVYPKFAGLCSADIYPIRCKEGFDPEFLKYVFLTKYFTDYAVSCSLRTSGMPKINRNDLRKATFFLPSDLLEQKKIAEVLSETDILISNLEKLIAKKKAIKQGVMQELLTGKRRLPGFNGEWQKMKIGENGTLQKGSIDPQLQPEKYFYEYSMPAFDASKKPNHVQGKTMHSNRTAIQGKVLLFNKLNVRQKRVWFIGQCEENAICSGEFLPYSSDKIDLLLLSQILLSDKVTDDFIRMSTGSSNSQKRITPKSFLEYSLYLPTDIEEQKALADILNNMDMEIYALQRKLEKYQRLKQGMMQKLLTGEIRLV